MSSGLPALPPIRLVSLLPQPEVAAGRPTLTDLRELRVEEFLQARSLAASSQKVYRRELNRFLNWTDRPWTELTPRQIAQYKDYLCSQGLAPNSINRSLTALMSFFAWWRSAYPEQLLQNPTSAVELERVPLPPAQDLSEVEPRALYGAIEQRGATAPRDRAILDVLSHGLRAEEVVNLNVGDFDGVRLTIRMAKDDSTGTVPLRRQAREQLNSYLVQRQSLEGELVGDRPLFVSWGRNRNGQRLGYQGLYYVVKALGAIASRWAEMVLNGDLEGQLAVPEWMMSLNQMDLQRIVKLVEVHPHQLRHTFATGLLLNGMESIHARTLTRHKSEVSFKRYAKRALAAAAERAFFEAIGEEVPE